MRRPRRIAFVGLALVLLAPPLRAAQVRGTFSTLLSGRQDPRRGDVTSVVPVYELASVRVLDLGLPGAEQSQLVMQGWGRVQLGDDEGKDNDADLSSLYLDARSGGTSVRLGRQLVVSGVGRMEMIDGGLLRQHVGAGFSAQVYGGATVHRRLRYRKGGWAAGTRLAKRFGGPAEVGVSYKHARRRGEVVRSHAGVDAMVRAGSTRTLFLAMADPGAAKLVEGRLAVSWDASDDLACTVDIERTVPDLMLPADSIFTVFSNVNRDTAGAVLDYTPSPFYRLEVDARVVMVDGDVLGYEATLDARTFREPSHRSVIGAELKRLDDGHSGYVRGRALTSLRFTEQLRVAGDVYVHRFDEEVNAVSTSVLAQASVVMDLSASMRVAATVAGGSTPFATHQVEGMLRFAYGYAMDLAREAGP